jgi:MoaA/NifB/PqqE/SkfB family radical SAM enzyme
MKEGKDNVIKNIEISDNENGIYISRIEESAKKYIKQEEYEKLERLMLNNKEYIEEEKYHYYLYESCKYILENKKISIEEKIYKLIEFICEYIEKNDTDNDVIKVLAILLRKNIYDKEKKEKIIEILERYRKISKKPRAKNIFLNEKEILEKKVILKSKPRHITVELTTRCNISCIICGFSNIENKYKYKTISDTFISFFKENISYFERIIWQGGEPFIYSQIYDLIDLAKKNNVYQQISTNFLLVDENKLKQLCSKNITLFISIDGVTKNIYEKIRYGANFDALLNKLDILVKNKNMKTIMAVVLIKLNYNQIDDMVKFAIKYKFDEIVFQKYMNKKNIDLDLDKNQLNFVLEKICLYKKLYLNDEIPIKISSTFEIKEDLEKTKKQKVNIEYKRIGERLNEVSDILLLKKKNNENKDYCFCYAPWTNLCLYSDNILKIACNSIDIKFTGKEIWNNNEFVKYRQMIIDKNLLLCRKECSNRGEESSSTRMGI